MKRLLGALSIALALCAVAIADDTDPKPIRKKPSKEDIENATKAVHAYLKKIKVSNAKIEHIADDSAAQVLPEYVFFSVRFRQFPVAKKPPDALKASNVLVFGRDDQVHALTTSKELETFFKDKLPALKSKARVEEAALAWLRLSQEFIQDGFYRFQIEKDSTRVSLHKNGGWAATAKVVVMAGGNGTMLAKLSFDKTGRLDTIKEEIKIKRGPRPICQATKLLDKDPVVHAMAEQELLYMGRVAKPYLDEQRAKASESLKKAIDAIWKRIVESEP